MPRQRTERGPNIWVVHHQGRFSVKEQGRRDLLVRPVSQGAAVGIARLIARAYRSELIVQGIGGRIRLRDSHGADPCPPRG